MSERVSLGVVGRRLGVSGGDNRRAGYGKVTRGRLEAWGQDPPTWLRKAQTRKRRPAGRGRSGSRRIEVSCCVCGAVRDVRPRLVEGYTHLVCGPCSRNGKRPEVPNRPGMVLVHTFNVAGYFDGYFHRIATVEDRASVRRAAALASSATWGGSKS